MDENLMSAADVLAQTYYLIERTINHEPRWIAAPSRYWSGLHHWLGARYFTHVRRFATRAEAEEYLPRLHESERDAVVTEHTDIGPPATPALDGCLRSRPPHGETRQSPPSQGGLTVTKRLLVLCDVDGTLTDGTVLVNEDGSESLRFHKRDAWLLPEATAAGIDVALITSEANHHAAKARATKLGLDIIYAPNAEGKLDAVRRAKEAGNRVVYVGDAPMDLLAMVEADQAFCPADGVHLGLLLSTKGGEGVLFEVLSKLLRVAGLEHHMGPNAPSFFEP